MTRLCVVSALYHPNLGGLGRQAQLLSERLRRDGVELFVVSRSMDVPEKAAFSPDVEIIRIPALCPRKHILEEISIENMLISLSFSMGCLFVLVLRRNRYDIVHFHGASIPLFISIPVLKMMGKKIVAKVAAANLGTEAGSLSGRYWPAGDLLSWIIRKVDAFVAISDEIRDGLIRDGVSPGKIHRISNFIDPEIFHPAAAEERERLKSAFGHQGKTLVLYAGRLVQRKGIEYLLQAWREIAPEFPDARLLILGEGPLRNTLESMTARLGIDDSVRFGGRVFNVPEYMRASDLFVLPSLQEGLPNSLLEAMASGLPAIVTRIGGVVDVVEEGKTALIAEPSSPGTLIERMRTLLGDPVLRETMGRVAARKIEESFGLNSRSLSYRNLYESLYRGEAL